MDFLRASFKDHEDAWKCFVQGYQLQMQGHFAEALELYQKSVQIFPTAEALTFIGWTYSLMKELEIAIEYCKHAIETDADFGNPYNDIGSYLIKLERPEEAIDWLLKALQAVRYETPHYAHINLANAYELLGDIGQAIEHYRVALRYDPEHMFANQRLTQLVSRIN